MYHFQDRVVAEVKSVTELVVVAVAEVAHQASASSMQRFQWYSDPSQTDLALNIEFVYFFDILLNDLSQAI